MTADLFGNELAKALKERGFKKKRLNWYKQDDKITLLFYIQKSYWGKDVWYYWFGVSINELHDKIGYTIDYFDIGTRFDQQLKMEAIHPCLKDRVRNLFGGKDSFELSANDVISLLDMWMSDFGKMEELTKKKSEAEFPYESSLNAINYIIEYRETQ